MVFNLDGKHGECGSVVLTLTEPKALKTNAE